MHYGDEFSLSLAPTPLANSFCEVQLTLERVVESEAGLMFLQEDGALFDSTKQVFFTLTDKDAFYFNGPSLNQVEGFKEDFEYFKKFGRGTKVVQEYNLCQDYNFADTREIITFASVEVTLEDSTKIILDSNELIINVTHTNLLQVQNEGIFTCSNDETDIIRRALNNAENSLTNALLELPEVNFTLYPTYDIDLLHWFNDFDQVSEFQQSTTNSNIDIKDGLQKIYNLVIASLKYLDGEDTEDEDFARFSCGGTSCIAGRYYAYVIKTSTDRKVVFLCDVFWEAPRSEFERDSQPGTIIHELSHFRDVGDTDDHRYGSPAIDQLAVDDMQRARDNADSWEAFTETLAFDVDEWNRVAQETEGFPEPLITEEVESNGFMDLFSSLPTVDIILLGICVVAMLALSSLIVFVRSLSKNNFAIQSYKSRRSIALMEEGEEDLRSVVTI